MITTKSNGYTMSRDFPDRVPRMRVEELQDRLGVPPEAMPQVVAIGAPKFVPDDKLVICADDVWLTELQVYGLIDLVRRDGPRGEARRLAHDVLRQCIKAFVDERRRSRRDEAAGAVCVTPGNKDMFREGMDGSFESNEGGALLTMIAMASAGDLDMPTSEALRRTIQAFGRVLRLA
jgi:hypothetical protein